MGEFDQKELLGCNQVIDEIIEGLSDAGAQAIRENPSPDTMHFGLGLYIRNKYIYSGRMGWSHGDPDAMSSDITREVSRRLLPEYDAYPLAFDLAGSMGIYHSVHEYAFGHGLSDVLMDCVERHYSVLSSAQESYHKAVKDAALFASSNDEVTGPLEHSKQNLHGRGPGAETLASLEYLETPLDSLMKAEKEFSEEIAEDMMTADGSLEIAKRDGIISAQRIDELIRDSRAMRSRSRPTDAIFLPPALVFLANPAYKGTENWNKSESSLSWFLRSVRQDGYEGFLPRWIFEDEDVALLSLGIDGGLLSQIPERAGDLRFACAAVHSSPDAIEFVADGLKENRDVLKAAMSSGCAFVLEEEPYSRYSDDEELVEVAVRASCSNFAYASKRLKSDVGMAMLAIESSKSDGMIDNFYDELGRDVLSRRDVVEAIARCPCTPIRFPPKCYRDDDRVGELLADKSVHESHYSLRWMSRRIKERYMNKDELERWGDEPCW
jgi:hypothetical protein